MRKFKLTFEWDSTKPVSVIKEFNTGHNRRAWGLARRWQNNCLQICGRNEKGELPYSTTLEIIPN